MIQGLRKKRRRSSAQKYIALPALTLLCVHIVQLTRCILSFRNIKSEMPFAILPKVQSKLIIALRKVYPRDEIDPLICSVVYREDWRAMKLFLKESARIAELGGVCYGLLRPNMIFPLLWMFTLACSSICHIFRLDLDLRLYPWL